MTTAKLNVLVLESERGAADAARHDLEQAGHRVFRCHEPGSAAFPCNALADGHDCPLDAQTIDVALDVRPRPRSQPAPQEDGVRCALQRHVPVVVAGSEVLNPYAAFDIEIVDRAGDVVGACERAAHAPLRKHSQVAARAARAVLDRRGLRHSPMVDVRRVGGALIVHVGNVDGLPEGVKYMMSVRICAAIREVDHVTRNIDVIFVT
jgi:hypothetical protein